jgi:hypothetical protein
VWVLSRYGTHCRNAPLPLMPTTFSPGFPGLLESIYVTHHAFGEFHSIPDLSSHHQPRYLGRRRSEQYGEVGDERVLTRCGMYSYLKDRICSSLSRSPSYWFIEVCQVQAIRSYTTIVQAYWLLYGITAESDYFTWGRSSSPQSMTNPHQASSVGNRS